MSKHTEAEKAEAVKKLREILKPGDDVYTILRHVSKSGMFRRISPVIITKNGPRDISGYAETVLGCGQRKGEGVGVGVGVSGCGMDMGFHLVYQLSAVIFGSDFKYPKAYKGEKGGYALKQRWL